jgi:translation initiation factor IF-3
MLLYEVTYCGSTAPQVRFWKEWCKVAAEEEPRVNGQIRARSVRLISESGEQLGIKHIREAMDYAEGLDLDLVEVAPNSDPPVVRTMDYGKYKYQKEQARKAARKKQVNINVREIKLRPKIGDHDFNTKRGHVERFLRHGDKVKVTIMFRGREVQHPDLGEKLLTRLAEDLSDLGRIESQPKLDGRNMVMVMAPNKDAAASMSSKGEARGHRQESAARG